MTNPKHTSSDLVERLRKRREAEMIGGYEWRKIGEGA